MLDRVAAVSSIPSSAVRRRHVHGLRLFARRLEAVRRQRESRADRDLRRQDATAARHDCDRRRRIRRQLSGRFRDQPDGRRCCRSISSTTAWSRSISKPARSTQSVRVGRNPFGVCLSPDGKHAWVSNVGMFEYPLLPGVNADESGHGRPVVSGLRRAVERGRTGRDDRRRVHSGPGQPQPSRRHVGLQGESRHGQGRGQDQDRLPGRRAAQEHQHGRRRQPQHGGRGQAVRLRLERHERQHLGHRRRRRTKSSRTSS